MTTNVEQLHTAWTKAHAKEAERQGWSIFETDERGLEIERDDEAGIFDSDEDALKYVTRQAERGNACAIAALALVAEAQAAKADEDEEPIGPTAAANWDEKPSPDHIAIATLRALFAANWDGAADFLECISAVVRAVPGHADTTPISDATKQEPFTWRDVANVIEGLEYDGQATTPTAIAAGLLARLEIDPDTDDTANQLLTAIHKAINAQQFAPLAEGAESVDGDEIAVTLVPANPRFATRCILRVIRIDADGEEIAG